MATRPFRSPHHTISEAGLVGGGSIPAPGEISLAHNGILFLDELPEFNRRTLEVMRQPLEEACVTISRAIGSVTFPANLMLVAAMNPCPCGFRGDPKRACNCSPMQVERYIGRISGPLLDRIDIHVEVPNVPFRELSNKASGTDSSKMRDDVIVAREMQTRRFAGQPAMVNGRMSPKQIRTYCKLETDAENLLKTAMEEMGAFSPSPRQDPARQPDHRRPRTSRPDLSRTFERSDQLPNARPQLLAVGQASEASATSMVAPVLSGFAIVHL